MKIPSGSLIDYSSYGDATEKSVEAGQSVTILSSLQLDALIVILC